MAPVTQTSCFAGLDRSTLERFMAILKISGFPLPGVTAELDVVRLGALKPDILVCDIDGLTVDAHEFLRQSRFVLPNCMIVVCTAKLNRAWCVECHLAGANGVLVKDSTNAQLASGIRNVLASGCFSDPRFAAA